MKYHYVEVAYSSGVEGKVCGLHVGPATVEEVLLLCQIPYQGYDIGINGTLVSLDTPIKDADRIELYPPLRVDPKTKRIRLVERRKR
jgi:putative ubiquitin-RnfH superfamily antitoxin RatB of RatAB toxin-antitoxin module